MKVYLAAAYSRRQEMKQLATELSGIGVEVTGHWFDKPEGVTDTTVTNKYLIDCAIADIRAIREADYFVRFPNDLHGSTYVRSDLATAGKDFETGYAFALGKPIFVVGGKQNIFDRLPNMVHVKDEAALLRALNPIEVM